MLNIGEIMKGRRRLPHRPPEREAEIEKAQILVIDDEPSVADALKLILEDEGYRVAVALTGREGLELTRRRCFDVVVSDVRLPDVSGLDVLRDVRRGCPASVVILITSHVTTNLLAEARGGGAFDVLHKPFIPSDVLRLVSAALDRI